MTPADFLAAVNAVVRSYPSRPFSISSFPHNPCPDQIVASLINGSWTDLARKRLLPKRQHGQRVLHVVLESPHADEFGPSPQFSPLGPAMGTTGANLKKYLALIPGLQQGHFLVHLINAIQYQCSLGSLGNRLCKKRRDHIWHECWHNHNGRSFFLNRLRCYYQKNDLVVVAATQSILTDNALRNYNIQGIKEAKKYVIDSVLAALGLPSVGSHTLWPSGVTHADILTYHPSCWHSFHAPRYPNPQSLPKFVQVP